MPDNPPAKVTPTKELATLARKNSRAFSTALIFLGFFASLAGCLAGSELVTIFGLLIFAAAMAIA